MHYKFLKYLVCPSSKEPLTLQEIHQEENGFIVSGNLSTSSGRRYPIINGIPRFVSVEGYSNSFGFEWNKWPTVQFESFNKGKPMEGHTEKMWDTITQLPRNLENKVLVEFGCGPGRFLDLINKRGGLAIGLDMSLAVEAARKNFGHNTDILIVQGDILNPPFKDDAFDAGYSIGVLHHTPNPKKGLENLVRITKSGGAIVCSVYPDGGFYSRLSVKRLRKLHLKLSPILGNGPAIAYSYFSAYFLSPVFNKLKKIKSLERYIKSIEKKWLVTLFLEDRRWSYLDIFDAITPVIATTHSPDEVKNWFAEAGVKKVNKTNWNKTSLIGVK